MTFYFCFAKNYSSLIHTLSVLLPLKKISSLLSGVTVTSYSCAQTCTSSSSTTCCQSDNCNTIPASTSTVASCYVGTTGTPTPSACTSPSNSYCQVYRPIHFIFSVCGVSPVMRETFYRHTLWIFLFFHYFGMDHFQGFSIF